MRPLEGPRLYSACLTIQHLFSVDFRHSLAQNSLRTSLNNDSYNSGSSAMSAKMKMSFDEAPCRQRDRA